MANKHPNMSGLKPFNKLTPEHANYIRHLGGVAHGRQYSIANERNAIIECRLEEYRKKTGYSLDEIMINMLYERASNFEKRYSFNEQLQAWKELCRLRAGYDKIKDKVNALLFQTTNPKNQQYDTFDNYFPDGEVVDIAMDMESFNGRVKEMTKEEYGTTDDSFKPAADIVTPLEPLAKEQETVPDITQSCSDKNDTNSDTPAVKEKPVLSLHYHCISLKKYKLLKSNY